MIVTLLCVFLSKTLALKGLTLYNLFEWYVNHPFLFMLAFSELVYVSRKGASKEWKKLKLNYLKN